MSELLGLLAIISFAMGAAAWCFYHEGYYDAIEDMKTKEEEDTSDLP